MNDSGFRFGFGFAGGCCLFVAVALLGSCGACALLIESANAEALTATETPFTLSSESVVNLERKVWYRLQSPSRTRFGGSLSSQGQTLSPWRASLCLLSPTGEIPHTSRRICTSLPPVLCVQGETTSDYRPTHLAETLNVPALWPATGPVDSPLPRVVIHWYTFHQERSGGSGTAASPRITEPQALTVKASRTRETANRGHATSTALGGLHPNHGSEAWQGS